MKMALKTAILLTLLCATTAFGQQQGLSFNFFGGGARSEGMGQAFIGVSDDGTAGSWNPAGLQFQEKTLMVFAYSAFMPKGEFTYQNNLETGVGFKHDGTMGALSYLHITTPIRVKNHHVVLDIGYTRNFDVYYKFGEVLFEDWADDTTPNSVYEREGGINTINFAFGTKLYNKISFGVSANIYNGKIVTNENRYFEREGVHSLYGSALYSSDVSVIDSATYTGFNTTIGFLYKTEKLGIGLNIRTPFKLKGESDSTLDVVSYRQGLTDVEVVTPDSTYYVKAPVGDPVQIVFDDWGLDGYSNFVTQTVYIDNITSRMEIPLSIGLGLSYYLSDNLLLASDFEYRGYEGGKIENLEYKLISADGTTEEIYTSELNDPKWNNIFQYRFGLEYAFTPSFGRIPLRFGFRNEAFPTGDIVSISSVQDEGIYKNRIYYVFEYDNNTITGYSMSFGTGIEWSQVILDMAYTYTKYDQINYVSEGELHSENNWKNHRVNFSFTGYF